MKIFQIVDSGSDELVSDRTCTCKKDISLIEDCQMTFYDLCPNIPYFFPSLLCED